MLPRCVLKTEVVSVQRKTWPAFSLCRSRGVPVSRVAERLVSLQPPASRPEPSVALSMKFCA
eukprot:9582395-Lingulodinium_polyedra.AAC.1